MADRTRVYKTEGVILRRRNLGEADSIFTVFSDREGRFEAVARGVRKAKSRMRGHLEPLTRTQMMLAHGRTLDVFTQAETVSAYRAIREDLGRSALAMYAAELVDRFTTEGSDHPGVYALLVGTLEALEGGAPGHILRYFELQLMMLGGYEVQVEACASCGGRLAEEETLLSAAAGGLVCRACRAAAGGGRVVSVRVVKVLRFARSASFDAFAGLRVDEQLAHELQVAIGDLVRHIIEREPNTGRYLEEVARFQRRVDPA